MMFYFSNGGAIWFGMLLAEIGVTPKIICAYGRQQEEVLQRTK